MNTLLLKPVHLFFITSVVLFCLCSSDNIAGGGTEDVNTIIVIGKLLNPDGSAASHAQVQLIPEDYDPVNDSNRIILKDTTDTTGVYRFAIKDSGNYNAQFLQIAAQTRAIITNEKVQSDTTVFPPVVLSEPGRIKVTLPENVNLDDGYIYIPGTILFSYLKNDSGCLVLDSVPANTLSAIVYSTKNATKCNVLRFDVPVKSNETTTVVNPQWAYCRTLILNTSATGADIAATVTDFPVLVRLIEDNFNFSQAHKNGFDIRFTKQDNTFLAYEIEAWDMSGMRAEIWVKIDTIHGNDSIQSIMMYWGNPDAADSSNSAAVFDTTTGFQGVWHMGQDGNTVAFDATANHFNGTPHGMTAESLVEGIIGGAQQFDGISNYISLQATADSKLKFPQNGNYTLSAWVYTEIIDSMTQYIISKSNNSYNLLLSGYDKWEIYDVEDGTGLQSIYAEPTEKQWKYLTGVCKGDDMRLYVDGVCMDSVRVIISGVAQDPSYDVHIGKRSDSEYGYWNGMLDEVSISSVAFSPEWIKLCYMNQRKDDKLIVFK